jgi:MFS family permease
VTTAVEVLRQPAVRRYLASTALASLGRNILLTVLFKQVFDITGNELDIAWIGLAQFLPAVALVLVSGWTADRFDRRHVVACSLLLRASCGGAFVAYSVWSPEVVWPLFALAALYGAGDALLAPARRAMAPLIVPTVDFPRVTALWTATATGAGIIGPVLGGFLYSIGPANAYALAATLEFVAILPTLAIVFVRAQGRLTERPTLHAALDGLRFVRRTPIVLAIISLDLFAVLFGGAIALIPAVASDRLGVGDVAYGFLRAAPGIGAATMALVLAVHPVRRRVGPTLLVVVAVFGASMMLFGITTSFAVAFLALVVSAMADMVSMFIRGTILPLVTPDEQLGRVSAVEGVFIGASNELGAFESGVTARAFGLPVSIAGGGFITLVVASSFAVLFPALRRVDTFDELSPQQQPATRPG